jgi:glycosyltransferase involved in cell wall biosynthesis
MGSKVSVITVCYNAEEFIENAINSVLKQTYENLEYIIIDGASKDNTVSIINKYKSRITFFLSEPDNGMYEAMNKGIKAATGDVLYFLNSDDDIADKCLLVVCLGY